MNLRERILNNSIPEPNTGCWLWLGAPRADGYGQMSVPLGGGRWKHGVKAHRVSYQSFVGEIPSGLTIDHLCNVPSCVNPAHLRPTPQGENALRGRTNAAAVNLRKTHCINGHALALENVYLRTQKNGKPTRTCRACHKARATKYRRAAGLLALLALVLVGAHCGSDVSLVRDAEASYTYLESEYEHRCPAVDSVLPAGPGYCGAWKGSLLEAERQTKLAVVVIAKGKIPAEEKAALKAAMKAAKVPK